MKEVKDFLKKLSKYGYIGAGLGAVLLVVMWWTSYDDIPFALAMIVIGLGQGYYFGKVVSRLTNKSK